MRGAWRSCGGGHAGERRRRGRCRSRGRSGRGRWLGHGDGGGGRWVPRVFGVFGARVYHEDALFVDVIPAVLDRAQDRTVDLYDERNIGGAWVVQTE